jgi:uncharacterized protein (TIGR03000 family)
MRNAKLLALTFVVTLSGFTVNQAQAQLLNPCCRPVTVCCGPLIVRRPIIRNAAAELRLAAHYHLNYRFYRGVVYGPSVITDAPLATPTPATMHEAEKPYHEESAEQSDSVLQPIQPAQPALPDQEPVQPTDPASPEPAPEPASDDAPADDDTFQVEDPATTTLILTVPEKAVVRINGKATSSTGTTRTYISRNVNPSVRYRYRVEVSWKIGSTEYRALENIDMQPGQSVAKSFSTPDAPGIVQK